MRIGLVSYLIGGFVGLGGESRVVFVLARRLYLENKTGKLPNGKTRSDCRRWKPEKYFRLCFRDR